MPLILGTNSIKDTGFNVDNSCRFMTDTVMKRTNASTSTNRKQGCFSTWIKKCNVSGTGGGIITGYVNSTNFTVIYFDGDHRLCFLEYQGGSSAGFLRTPNILKDPSAWMHIAYLIDTTQGTAANRVKVYINGTQITSFHSGGTTQPSQDNTLNLFTASTSLDLGQDTSGSPHFMNGYLAETLLVDGATVAIGDLGEFDEDSPQIWKPKDISEISVGTNGFRLDYQDSSNLGNAIDGGTDLTETNLVASDQTTDSPTNSTATLNPLYKLSNVTFSEGNLQHTNTGSWQPGFSTIAVSSGKWYHEAKFTVAPSGSVNAFIGICKTDDGEENTIILTGNSANSWGYENTTGYKNNSSSTAASDYTAWAVGDIVGCYLDLDNLKLYFHNDGVLQNSGTGISITAGTYVLGISTYYGTLQVNYGNPPYSITSGNADDNGYGNFEYSPNITGDSVAKKFYALNTKNLAQYG